MLFRSHEQMLKYIPDYIEKVVAEAVNTDAMPEKWDENALNEALRQKVYPDECTFVVTREMLEKWDYDYVIKKISKEVIKAYEQKILNIAEMTDGQVDYHQVERNELLRSVDKNWIDHIDAMDQLRKGIGLRGYAQQDPVIAYKQEGYEMFDEMINRIQTTTISRLLKGRIVRVQNGAPSPVNPAIAARAREIMQQKIKEQEEAAKAAAQNANLAEQTSEQPAEEMHEAVLTPSNGKISSAAKTESGPVIGGEPEAPKDLAANIGGKQIPKTMPKSAKVGRNDPCPCGSGKKYKNCCGKV